MHKKLLILNTDEVTASYYAKPLHNEFDTDDVQSLLRVLRAARDEAIVYERHAIGRLIDLLEDPPKPTSSWEFEGDL
jgi:hypothetical protein